MTVGKGRKKEIREIWPWLPSIFFERQMYLYEVESFPNWSNINFSISVPLGDLGFLDDWFPVALSYARRASSSFKKLSIRDWFPVALLLPFWSPFVLMTSFWRASTIYASIFSALKFVHNSICPLDAMLFWSGDWIGATGSLWSNCHGLYVGSFQAPCKGRKIDTYRHTYANTLVSGFEEPCFAICMIRGLPYPGSHCTAALLSSRHWFALCKDSRSFE